MRRALMRLRLCPTHMQVDGGLTDLLVGCTVEVGVKGDATIDAISTALARVGAVLVVNEIDP